MFREVNDRWIYIAYSFVNPADLLFGDKWKKDKITTIKIFRVKGDRADLPITVSGVIVDTLIGITAAGIYGSFIMLTGF